MTQGLGEGQTTGSDAARRGQAGLYILVILAVVATVILLLVDLELWPRVALIVAMWAAALGSFFILRSRRDTQDARRELERAEETHREKLRAAEESARTDREELERARQREEQVEAEAALLAEIREELTTLRNQLEELSGRRLAYEPMALQAEARRMMQLQTAAATAAEEEQRKVARDAEWDDEAGPLESEVPTARPRTSRAPSADAIAGRLGSYDKQAAADASPLSHLISERQAAPQRAEVKQLQEAPGDQANEGGKGRRRRDENNKGMISVAELLARAKSADKE